MSVWTDGGPWCVWGESAAVRVSGRPWVPPSVSGRESGKEVSRPSSARVSHLAHGTRCPSKSEENLFPSEQPTSESGRRTAVTPPLWGRDRRRVWNRSECPWISCGGTWTSFLARVLHADLVVSSGLGTGAQLQLRGQPAFLGR